MAIFIMYTSHDFVSHKVTGGTRRFLELLYGLLDKGDTIHLFIPSTVSLKNYPNLILHYTEVSTSNLLPKGFINYFNNKRIISKAVSRLGFYDAFILIDVPYVLQVSLMKIPKIVFIVWQDFVGYRLISSNLVKYKLLGYIYKWLLIRSERLAIKGATKINVQCNYDLEVLTKRHPKLSAHIKRKAFVIPNNVNTSWLISVKNNDLLDNNQDDIFKICFIGNIDDKRKGLHLLLEASERLFLNGYLFKLEIIGAGIQLEVLKQRYKSNRNISFLGYTENPYPYLCNSHLMVVPSLADSFPNTVTEALFFEIPVIGAISGGIPEILVYDTLLFEADVESLYKKMKFILDNKEDKTIKQLVKERKGVLTFNWVEEMRKGIISYE